MTTNPESLLAVTQEEIPMPLSEYSYTELFNAIAAATSPYGGGTGVNVSVKAFLDTLATRPAPPAQPGREEVVPKATGLKGDDVLAFLGSAFRNIDLPPLGRDDVAEIGEALDRFIARRQPAAEPLLARQDGRAEAEELLHELNNLPMVHKGVQFDGWLLSEPTLKAILAALSTIPTEPASVREERLREALEHTRDELVRLAWDENHPLIVRIEAALSTEEPKL